MNDYRSDYRDAQREYYWTLPRVLVAGFVGVVALGGVGFVAKMILTPAALVSKTFDTDNIINNYEWYRDAYGNFQAKTKQVNQFRSLAAEEKDISERNRLRIEMAAIQQSCRELAQRYNANANKVNRSIFMGTNVPTNLSAGDCE